jgi:phosphoesterase RecJ-like protein
MDQNISKIINTIELEDGFVITSHIHPDGDSIGAQLAFLLLLESLGKKVEIINQDPIPEPYLFLPQSHRIKPIDQIKDFNSYFNDYKVGVLLDCSEWERVGKVSEYFRKLPLIINIDHHPDNNGLGKYNYIDEESSAVAEQIYNIFKEAKYNITYDIALCLYVAILTDTGSFKQANTTSYTHQVVADLLSYGISPSKIYDKLYDVKTSAIIHLIGLVLSTVQLNKSGEIAWVRVTKGFFDEVGLPDIEADWVMDYLRTIKGVKVNLLFREIDESSTKVNFRSKIGVDVGRIAKCFKGGGHHQAAGATVNFPLEIAEKKVVSEVEKALNRKH